MENMKGELSLAQTRIIQQEEKIRSSEELAHKYKMDLESFREFAFKQIKDKEFSLIEQGTKIRSLESDMSLIKNQSCGLIEQYEQLLKKLNLYKEKYRRKKQEIRDLKSRVSLGKSDTSMMNLQQELISAQKRIGELTQSREELAKKYTDLEIKNQHLSNVKSDIRTRMHKQTKTLTEMELDFKNILEGVESQKSEEVNDLLEKVSSYEKIIKDIKKNNSDLLEAKQEEIDIEKLNVEEGKRQIAKLEKIKYNLELDYNSCKKVLNDHNNQLLNQQIEFEAKIDNLIKEHREKVMKYKGQINGLELENKRLLESNDITRKSILIGESLFDELSELNNDFRDSKQLSMKTFQESVFKQFEETDSRAEKLSEKLNKKKIRSQKLKNELAQAIEQLSDTEKVVKTLQNSLSNKEETILQQADSIQEITFKLTTLESDKTHKEGEINRFKDQNIELTEKVKTFTDKYLNSEAEMARFKSHFEKSVEELKSKYNNKIVKYKEEIMELTEKCRKTSEDSVKVEEPVVNEEFEKSKKLMKKNMKLKEKVDSLGNCLKSKTDIISKLQSKLREFYLIPNVDENLEECTKSNLGTIKEENEDSPESIYYEENLRRMKSEYESSVRLYKLQIDELIKMNQELRELTQVKHEILIISEPQENENKEMEIETKNSKIITKIEETTKNNLVMASQSSIKVNMLKEKIKSIAEELNFSTEIVSSISMPADHPPEQSELLDLNVQNIDCMNESESKIVMVDSFDIDSPTEIQIYNKRRPKPLESMKIETRNKDTYFIKENMPDDYSELLRFKLNHEHILEALKRDYENKMKILEEELRKSRQFRIEPIVTSDNLEEADKDSPIEKDTPLENSKKKIQDLEGKIFVLEQDVLVKNERQKRIENELKDIKKKYASLEEKHAAMLEKLKVSEAGIKKLEDDKANSKRNVFEMEQYSESEESLPPSRQSNIIATSVIENFEEITEGSVIEEEEIVVHDKFEAFKQSLLLLRPSIDYGKKAQELELELSLKNNHIRELQEKVKDLEYQILSYEKENASLKNQATSVDKKFEEFAKIVKKREHREDTSHDCVLHEAKMTLLQAHNQRLETELIVSKTNWGELTNSLLKDYTELEKLLAEARNDIRILSEEREELAKKITEKSPKKRWKFSSMFHRKKRNSDIV